MNSNDLLREFMNQPGGDIVWLIRALGVNYDEKSLPAGQSGYIEYDGTGYNIVVNSTENPRRRRFTAAHELSHYLLHRDLLDDKGKLNRHVDVLFGEGAATNPPDPLTSAHETQANRYAAKLLIPEHLVKTKFEELEQDVAALARLFDVSQPAMKIRLETLGKLPRS